MNSSIVIINKNDKGINDTLSALFKLKVDRQAEIIVIDASDHKLDWIKKKFPKVVWKDFKNKQTGKISIPEQRNIGIQTAKNAIVVFLDASCVPLNSEWLANLTKPIIKEKENIVRGSVSNIPNYITITEKSGDKVYVTEAPTINLAIRKRIFQKVGIFDESFEYGSDMDFTWRAVKSGYKIRYIETAPVSHDFGNTKQNVKRYLHYGRARARLYFNHPEYLSRFKNYELRSLIYFILIILSPVVFVFPFYLIILLLLLFLLIKGNGYQELSERMAFSYGLIQGFF